MLLLAMIVARLSFSVALHQQFIFVSSRQLRALSSSSPPLPSDNHTPWAALGLATQITRQHIPLFVTLLHFVSFAPQQSPTPPPPLPVCLCPQAPQSAEPPPRLSLSNLSQYPTYSPILPASIVVMSLLLLHTLTIRPQLLRGASAVIKVM